ncbi:pseudouridine synthase DEG1 [Aspergillus lucknowensis]|uniref:Pseudouridine synthase n=1 Tax=Aspergillus lucknowensis TaxID=176173 RepID=A0ABR4L9C1_9EURO
MGMWRFQGRPLRRALTNTISFIRASHRHAHKGLSKLDSLAADIMSGKNPCPPADKQQQSQQPQHEQHEQKQQPGQPDYSTWSTTNLIDRITELERQLHTRTAAYANHSSSVGVAQSVPEKAKAQAQPQAKIPKWLATGKYSPDDITHAPGARIPKPPRKMDPSKYHFRFIALKFAYLGQRYNGLEHANNNVTPLPTIEEELWKALRKTRLIFPTDMGDEEGLEMLDSERGSEPITLSWEGCEYSKAGRTDRGVSAFGQVIGIKVRSARPKPKDPGPVQGSDATMRDTSEATGSGAAAAGEDWDDVADELPYISLLNKTLPEDIRVLAWCPHPPEGFDARFSCRGRHYKYFFTQPAFSPTPGPLGLAPRGGGGKDAHPPKYREGWLDIDAMREAAKYFEGVHDFRNFCKVDTSKQLENFERIIYRSDIKLLDPKTNPLGYVSKSEFRALEQPAAETAAEELSGSSATGSQVYVFDLQGSAFLWHQVRHMVGILFLVGQGLEPPSVVPELLDISKNPRRPTYEMASDAPLVLWDCVFPDLNGDSREDALEWVYAGDPRQARSHYAKGGGKFGAGGVVEDLWSVWRQRKMDEVLAGALLDLVVQQGDQSGAQFRHIKDLEREIRGRGQKVFYGANEGKIGGKYVPLMQKRKVESVEVLNARWLAKQRRLGKNPQESNREV